MATVANRRSVMVLYSDTTSPIGHCVRIVLAEKDVNVEVHYISHENRPQELLDLNPYHSAPTLIDRDLVLYDPQIIMEYLDERFPHPPLMPVDPVSRASNRQLRYRVMRDLYGLIDELNSDNEIAAANARRNLRDSLTAIAPAFSQLPYFMSEEYTLTDCCLAPLLWRLGSYGITLPISVKTLHSYSDALFERDAFQSSLSELERDMGKVSRV